ncbi:MAG: hypothetical protein EZS28_055981, partial [Streblomastix strix]
NQVQEPRYLNRLLLDSSETALTRRIVQEQQPLWNKESAQKTDQSVPTPIDLTKLSINMNQQQFSAHGDFQAQRNYTLRYLGLRSNIEYHKVFGEDLLNVSAFIQKHARHEYLTVND